VRPNLNWKGKVVAASSLLTTVFRLRDRFSEARLEAGTNLEKLPRLTSQDIATGQFPGHPEVVVPAWVLLNKRDHDGAASKNALAHVVTMSRKVGSKIAFSVYPYPLFVSPKESILGHALWFHAVLDLRDNRVFPELMQKISAELKVPLWNAYPIFERDPDGMYGKVDMHFNARGYEKYAQFLTDRILETQSAR